MQKGTVGHSPLALPYKLSSVEQDIFFQVSLNTKHVLCSCTAAAPGCWLWWGFMKKHPTQKKTYWFIVMTKSLYSLQVGNVNSLFSPSLWLSDLVNLWPSAVRSLIVLAHGQLGSDNLMDTHWNGLDRFILGKKDWKIPLAVNSVFPLTRPVKQ